MFRTPVSRAGSEDVSQGARLVRRLARIWVIAVALLSTHIVLASARGIDDWMADWAVEPGFRLEIDSGGYQFPTAIAFVPQPGPRPDDPLYFVTELRGTIKVVTNDRSVRVFAERFFELRPQAELPDMLGEMGLTGLCLDATHGYVFVTYAYQDRDGILRNGISRFESVPGSLSLRPTGRLDLATDILSRDRSMLSHQIGPCQVDGDSLYVSVGDGKNHLLSRSLSSTLGKILRFTLDGNPHPGNPFLQDGGEITVASYVWAYGFRNPFGLKRVDGRTFVADNGMALDRFLEVNGGEDYLWNGTDWSISARAQMVFSPAVGPVQVDYHPAEDELFPAEYRTRFYIATFGEPAETVRKHGAKSVVTLGFDFEHGRVTDPPARLVHYRGTRHQGIAALAFGPDGLYFAPLFPHAGGGTYVLKLTHDAQRQHPFLIGANEPLDIIWRHGCLGCHLLHGIGNTVAPSLNAEALVPRLHSKLHSGEYVAILQRLAEGEPELTPSAAAAAEVLTHSGMDRVRAWIAQYVLNPRFDGSTSGMPTLAVSRAEAATLAQYLAPDPPSAFLERVQSVTVHLVGPLRYRKFGLAVLGSFTVGVLSALILQILLSRGMRRRRGSAIARN